MIPPAQLPLANVRPKTAARVYAGPKLPKHKRIRNVAFPTWKESLSLVADPGNAGRNTGTDTTNTKKDTEVLHSCRGVGELDNVASYGYQHADNDEHATLEYPIRPPSDAQCSKETECIRRDGKQIRIGVGVTKFLDN